MFDIDLYKAHLNDPKFGEISYFPILDSTNSKSLELSEANTRSGTVIFTDQQTAGRGRRNHKWSSVDKKSLTFSIILYTNCSIDQICKYSIITGLAISDSLKEIGLSPELKWPNDIVIENKKICGILIESKLSEYSIKALVVGIGLNVNEEISDFPKNLKRASTSINIEKGKEQVREILLASIVNNFRKRLLNIDGFLHQIDEWEQQCAHMNGTVTLNNTDNIVGIFKGLTATGSARISVRGKEEIFNSGVLETL
jgi:BirA family biotin operon repressor/biotin-[acetyl-CoA-carboxylase] ligase